MTQSWLRRTHQTQLGKSLNVEVSDHVTHSNRLLGESWNNSLSRRIGNWGTRESSGKRDWQNGGISWSGGGCPRLVAKVWALLGIVAILVRLVIRCLADKLLANEGLLSSLPSSNPSEIGSSKLKVKERC